MKELHPYYTFNPNNSARFILRMFGYKIDENNAEIMGCYTCIMKEYLVIKIAKM